MGAQFITTSSGERLVVLPEAEYEALLETADERADVAAIQDFRSKLARGEEEFVPSSMVDRILAGESAIRVWREHRGLTATALAEAAGLPQAELDAIEAGTRAPGEESLAVLARALRVDPDDLV